MDFFFWWLKLCRVFPNFADKPLVLSGFELNFLKLKSLTKIDCIIKSKIENLYRTIFRRQCLLKDALLGITMFKRETRVLFELVHNVMVSYLKYPVGDACHRTLIHDQILHPEHVHAPGGINVTQNLKYTFITLSHGPYYQSNNLFQFSLVISQHSISWDFQSREDSSALDIRVSSNFTHQTLTQFHVCFRNRFQLFCGRLDDCGG